MTSLTDPDAPPASAMPSVRTLAAVVIGNALEFYDFLAYSFFAVQIGRTFFPAHDETTSVLAALAVFGAGFIPRPIGAWFFGRIGDRRGRKPAMLASFTLMGLSLAGVALTPGYQQIGVAAPVLVCLFRLLQGFALGGEVGPNTAFLLEAAPPGRGGLMVSLQLWSQAVANLLGGLAGLAIGAVVGAQALNGWGWRLAFIAGLVILPIGLVLRQGLTETLPPQSATVDTVDTPRAVPPGFWRRAWLGVAMLASATIVTYGLINLTTYAQNTLHLSKAVAYEATSALGLIGLIASPLGGWLADRLGRKPVMIAATLPLALAAPPLFWLMVRRHDALALVGGAVILRALGALSAAPVIVAITEALPPQRRASALGLIYALAITVFGGSTQFVITALIKTTGNPVMPGWYMAGATAVGLAAMLAFPETRPTKT